MNRDTTSWGYWSKVHTPVLLYDIRCDDVLMKYSPAGRASDLWFQRSKETRKTARKAKNPLELRPFTHYYGGPTPVKGV